MYTKSVAEVAEGGPRLGKLLETLLDDVLKLGVNVIVRHVGTKALRITLETLFDFKMK